MGDPATDIGNETGHVIEVHLDGIGRREIMGNHDDISLDPGQIIVLLSHQITKDPLSHIIYIVFPLPQVFILDGIEGGAQLPDDDIQGPFGIDPAGFDRFYGILDQHRILQDHKMNIQDEEVPSHLLSQNLLLNPLELVP